jgi:biopolymer transport protein ExbB/TolQ
MSTEDNLPNIELDKTASVYIVLGQLKAQIELLLRMEDNRGAELTRILDGYQKSTNSRMDQIERDLENRTDRLEKEDSSLQQGLKETTEKFEKALKTTNDTVSGLRDKVTGAVAVLALIGFLSPFLPKMIASILPSTPYHPTPTPYVKP